MAQGEDEDMEYGISLTFLVINCHNFLYINLHKYTESPSEIILKRIRRS